MFSGPVSSGKTTTMYKLALDLAQENQQVITIEDPVEIYVENFLQLQVHTEIQQTYEALVKVCLRHRPDILIIGEIRDQQTAKMVIRAALTGHCVLATIHAPDKYGVIDRLIELGISKLDILHCVKLINYQRILSMNHQTTVNDKYRILNNQAVLFDYLKAEEIDSYCTTFKKIYTTWNSYLKKAWEANEISNSTYSQTKYS